MSLTAQETLNSDKMNLMVCILTKEISDTWSKAKSGSSGKRADTWSSRVNWIQYVEATVIHHIVYVLRFPNQIKATGGNLGDTKQVNGYMRRQQKHNASEGL